MPQVPGITPTVQPSGAAPEINLPVPTDAFGGAVAHALEGFGGQVEQSSNQIWQRAMELQGLNNETAAKNKDAEFMKQSAMLDADFLNKEGLNAGPEALSAHIQRLDDLRTKLRADLNPAAARMYDSSSLSTMGSYLRYAARHSGEQVKAAADTADKVALQAYGDHIGNNPGDDLMARRLSRAGDVAIQRMGERRGLDQATINEMIKTKNSEFIGKRINGFARDGKNDQATNLYEAAKKNDALTDNDELKADQAIKLGRYSVGAPYLANDVYKGGLDEQGKQTKSLADLQAEVRDRAKKDYPDDPLYAQHAVNSIDQIYGTNVRAERDERWQAKQTIAELQQAGADNLQKLTASPIGASAYHKLTPEEQNAITFKYNKVANDRNFTRLLGMAKSQDEDVKSSFMDTDLNSQPLTDAARRQLLTERARILSKPQEDSRVWRAMRWLQGSPYNTSLQSLGLYRRDARDPDEYDRFIGDLDQALDDYQKTSGKPAGQKEVIKDIAPLLIQSTTSQNWFQKNVSGGVSENAQRTVVPDKERENIIKANQNEGRRPLTEAEIGRVYTRALINKLYPPKVKSTEAPVPSSATPTPPASQ